MSLRRLLFIILALGVSGVTAFLGRTWLQSERTVQAAPVPPPPVDKPPTQILVAKGTLSAGQFVHPENLRWQPWPETGIAPNYIQDGKYRLEDFVGAVVRTGLNDGEPITEGRVAKPGDHSFAAVALSPGSRAVTITVTVASGVAGFIFPGDRVDVVLTYLVTDSGGKGNEKGPDHRASETLLTDVRVLGVDQRIDDQTKTETLVAKTVTLEVTPKQAEIIAVATDVGKLSLTLRSAGNTEGTEPVAMASHTWDSEAAKLLPPAGGQKGASSTIKVSVVRAAAVEQVEFDDHYKRVDAAGNGFEDFLKAAMKMQQQTAGDPNPAKKN